MPMDSNRLRILAQSRFVELLQHGSSPAAISGYTIKRSRVILPPQINTFPSTTFASLYIYKDKEILKIVLVRVMVSLRFVESMALLYPLYQLAERREMPFKSSFFECEESGKCVARVSTINGRLGRNCEIM